MRRSVSRGWRSRWRSSSSVDLSAQCRSSRISSSGDSRPAVQQCCHRLEQAVAQGVVLAVRGAVEDVARWREVGQQAPEDLAVLLRRSRHRGVRPRDELAQRLDERLVRKQGLLVRAAVEHHTAAGLHLLGELGGEARLADARLADEQHQSHLPRLALLPTHAQTLQGLVAPDEGPLDHLRGDRRQHATVLRGGRVGCRERSRKIPANEHFMECHQRR